MDHPHSVAMWRDVHTSQHLMFLVIFSDLTQNYRGSGKVTSWGEEESKTCLCEFVLWSRLHSLMSAVPEWAYEPNEFNDIAKTIWSRHWDDYATQDHQACLTDGHPNTNWLSLSTHCDADAFPARTDNFFWSTWSTTTWGQSEFVHLSDENHIVGWLQMNEIWTKEIGCRRLTLEHH